MSNSRPDWDSYFLGIAQAVSARADCTRRRIGAVIVDADHRVVSCGYNGAPSGEPGCLTDGACPRGRHYPYSMGSDECVCGEDWPCRISGDHGSAYDNCTAVHAESNALLYAHRSVKGCTMYITAEPCKDCTRLINGAGIERVHHP